jgi:hypothetical protein
VCPNVAPREGVAGELLNVIQPLIEGDYIQQGPL